MIITSMPDYYLQLQQFIGRTGRVGNKGSYSMVLYDKDARNIEADLIVKKKLA